MSVELLLVTHDIIGEVMRTVVKQTFGNVLPLPIRTFSCPADISSETLRDALHQQLMRMMTDAGVLILSDIYGATPCNLACHLDAAVRKNIRIVSGLNLPMLFRVMTYPNLSLPELAAKAFSGGQKGVRLCVGECGCGKDSDMIGRV